MRAVSNFIAALALCTASLVPAQTNYTTRITLANLLSGGAPTPYARVCAVPADAYGNPIPVSAPTWRLVLPSPGVCANVVAGALPNGLAVPDANHTNAAAPIRYNISIQVTTSTGMPVGAPVLLGAVPDVSGATFPLDSYTHTAATLTSYGASPDAATKSALFQPSGHRVFVTDVPDPITGGLVRASNHQAIATHRTGPGGNIIGSTGSARVEHGWINDNDHTMNVAAGEFDALCNSDCQIGGAVNVAAVNYGKGDVVGLTMDLFATGVNRGADEGNEVFRIFAEPHSNNWGVIVGTLTVDAMGQTVVQSTLDGNNRPLALAGHDLKAATENALVININPAKVYSAGNAQSISSCPSSLPFSSTYVCVTGDAGSKISSNFGNSAVTTLSAAVPLSNATLPDQFINGPVAFDLRLANMSGFTTIDGRQITISDANDSFEMPTVLSHTATTIHVFLSKAHAAGSLVTAGGGVGMALDFPADSVAPGGWTAAVDQGTNYSIYRMAWPVIATAPGDIIVTSQFPYNQATNLGTLAYAGTRITAPPAFTPYLNGGVLTAFNITGVGNSAIVLPSGTYQDGGIPAPLPTVSFTGGNCSSQPSAYLQYTNGTGAYFPVITKGGLGCNNTLAARVNSTYTNPYELRPAAWSRSNYNPNWVASVLDANSPMNQGDPNQIITAATAGYIVLVGASACTSTSGFCAGDPIESVYNMHQQQTSQINFFRQVWNSGTWGDIFALNFKGHGYGDHFLGLNNRSPASSFYGLPSTHYSPDANGNGVSFAPTHVSLSGASGRTFTWDQPPALSSAGGGALFAVHCTTGDSTAPCRNGLWLPYNIWESDEAAFNQVSLAIDPNSGRLTYNNTVPGYGIVAPIFLPGVVSGRCLQTSTNGQIVGVPCNDSLAGIKAGRAPTGSGTYDLNGNPLIGQSITMSYMTPPRSGSGYVGTPSLYWDKGYLNHINVGASLSLPFADGLLKSTSGNAGTAVAGTDYQVPISFSTNAKTLQLPNRSLTCSSTTGGTFNYSAGAPGVKDTVQVCAKDGTGVYAWRQLF